MVSEKSEREKEKNDRLQQLINYGVPLLGAGASAAVSSALGLIGPEGAAIGGMVGKGVEIWLSNVGQEISERHLGIREKVRVGAAFTIATAEIQRRLENGESLRADDFFHKRQTGISHAEEVTESVLLKVQREPEEKKIEYMGYLPASIAFDSEISVHLAHQLVNAAEQLTYRQLCILKLSMVKDNVESRDIDYQAHKVSSQELYPVLYECHDLFLKRLVMFGDGIGGIGFWDAKPQDMTIEPLGSDLFNLMKLCLIPDKDIVPIAEQLK